MSQRLLLSALLLSIGVGSASAQTSLAPSLATNTAYAAKDIGTLGAYPVTPVQLNDKAWVTGRSPKGQNQAMQGFLTGPNANKMRPLPRLDGKANQPNALNNHGVVVGRSNMGQGGMHAFMTGAQGMGILDLGALGGNKSEALAVNNLGQVVGYAETSPDSPNVRAFLYDSASQAMRPLGQCLSDASTARVINDQGVVAGTFACQPDPSVRVFVASPPDYVFVPYALDDRFGYQVTGIDPQGVVLGYVSDHKSRTRSFLVRPGMGMQELATPSNFTTVVAWSRNEAGTIVGHSLDGHDNAARAFVCSGDCSDLTDLNSLATLPEGVKLTDARSVNQAGQILASGSDGHGYLLTPAN